MAQSRIDAGPAAVPGRPTPVGSSAANAFDDAGVVGVVAGFADGEGGTEQGAGCWQVAQVLLDPRKVGVADGQGGVAGVVDLLLDGDGPAQQVAGLRQVAQVLLDQRQVGVADGQR